MRKPLGPRTQPITIPYDHFYVPIGTFEPSQRTTSNIRRFNEFHISTDIRKCRSQVSGRCKGWWLWTFEFRNGDTFEVEKEISLREAKRRGTYSPTFDLLYTDGLVTTAVDLLSPGPFKYGVVCLAKPVRLFKVPMMPLELLEVQATNNLGVSSTLNVNDGKARPLILPKAGLKKICWLGEAATKLEPCGQPTLFFHSFFVLNAIYGEQSEIIEKLAEINHRVFAKEKRYLWKPKILDKLRASVVDSAFSPELSAVNPTNWGAVPLLLKHVDPDLLIGLLSNISRGRLQPEVWEWQDWVEETILACLPDKKKAYEIPPLFIARPKKKVRRGTIPLTIVDLESKNHNLEVTWPQDNPEQKWPLMPKDLLEDPNCDAPAALRKLTAAHSKILRHALENARTLLSVGKPPHAIVGLTLDELASQYIDLCNRTVESGRRQEQALFGKIFQDDPEEEEKIRKVPPPTKLQKELDRLGALEQLDSDLEGLSDLAGVLEDVRTQLGLYRALLKKSLERPDRASDLTDHDSFKTRVRRQAKKFRDAYDKISKFLPKKDSFVEERFSQAQNMVPLEKQYGVGNDEDE